LIVFEKIEMMKNRSQLMFCVKMSQAAIQKQNCNKITVASSDTEAGLRDHVM
jgi:hypothetical protein